MAQFIKAIETTQLAVTEKQANDWLTTMPGINVISTNWLAVLDKPAGIHWAVFILYDDCK
jgi:hypothetical protein